MPSSSPSSSSSSSELWSSSNSSALKTQMLCKIQQVRIVCGTFGVFSSSGFSRHLQFAGNKTKQGLGPIVDRKACMDWLAGQEDMLTYMCCNLSCSKETNSKLFWRKMPHHFNCCVPQCTNNFRNKPNLEYYRIPKCEKARKYYKVSLRNESLKLDSSQTRICSEHFEGGQKLSRNHLPTIFPWTKERKSRREIFKHDFVPKKRKADLV